MVLALIMMSLLGLRIVILWLLRPALQAVFTRIFGKECTRCPPYDLGFRNIIVGVASAFVFAIIFIIAVVNEAGVTSTDSHKANTCNPPATFALLINFDLNWNTNLMELFSFTGSVSLLRLF